MKRDEIRQTVERHMDRVGFGKDTYTWVGAKLVLTVQGKFFRFDMKSGTSAKRLAYDLGRITGLAEFTGALAAASERRRARQSGRTNNAAIPAA